MRTEPGGVVTDTVINTDGSQQTTYPDGTVEVMVPGADPRWGLLAPIIASYTRTTPATLVPDHDRDAARPRSRPERSV